MAPRKKKAPKAKVTYRRVVPTFWNDRDVRDVLDLVQKAVLLYTFTNEHAHPCGIYRLRPRDIDAELKPLGYDGFLELSAGPLAPFVTYDEDTEEVFVRAMAEHQIDGGLHGKDLRIPWVEKQVASIRSDQLRRAFADRYEHWNLSRERMDVPETIPGVDNSSSEGPSDDASIHRRNGGRAGKTKGLSEGASERALSKGLPEGAYPKPAAAAATAEGSRTSTATTPSPTPPVNGGEGNHTTGHVNGGPPPPEPTRRQLIEAAEPTARASLNRMRGRDDEADVFVTPKGATEPQRVGYGLDLVRWRNLAEHVESVEPAVLARALWHAPDVLDMPAPITMALVEDAPGALAQMVHRALEERPVNVALVHDLVPDAKAAPKPEPVDPKVASRKAELRNQVALLQGGASTPEF